MAAIDLSDEGLRRLSAFLSVSYDRDGDQQTLDLGSGIYGDSRFYRATGKYPRWPRAYRMSENDFSPASLRSPNMKQTMPQTPSCLTDGDPAFAKLIEQVGPFKLKPEKRRSPFEALVRAVAHQQLNGKAASTILGRFVSLFGNGAFPSPKQVEEIEFEKLTGIGFSRAKASYVKAIAEATLSGIVPHRKVIERLEDEVIIERLTQIKGIGRWSVEMFLMFGLGRPDVLPVHDFGVQNGFAIVYRKRKPPTPAQLLKHGERWRPHRTTAAWYLWRAVDLARESKLVMNF